MSVEVSYDWFIVLNGGLYVLIAIISCPLHILVSLAMMRTGTVKKRITLRILLSLSIADFIQLVCHGIGGLSIVTGIPLNYTFNSFIGAAMNMLWALTLVQHVALAVNRLKVVSSRTVAQEKEFGYFDSSILISWLFGLMFSLGYSINGDYNLYFDAQNLNWAQRTSDPNVVFIRVLFWFRLSALSIGLISSLFVMITVICNRRAVNENTRLLTAKDFRLFIQTTIVFLLAITHVGTWNLVSDPNVYLLAVLNMEWVLVCALMPWLNIAMSADIRTSLIKKVLKPTHSQKSTTKTAVITVYNLTPRRF
ncbi:hypothetical protein M3Y95_00439200 [Aphelenchoides besseyi]|nr:hypothetical protein M3Y95_00439200 [Aphelenchoides besseyi]